MNRCDSKGGEGVRRGPDAEQLGGAVTARLGETLLVSVQARIVPPGTIERIEAGKAKRVIDRRTS